MAKAKTFFDVGTYTGNGGLYRVGVPTKRTAFNQQVGKSLRFRNSNTAFLSRSVTASNRQTFTISLWVKRGVLNTGYPQYLINGSTTQGGGISFDVSGANGFGGAGDNIIVALNGSIVLETTALYRDPSIWYHIVLAVDTTQATSSNRVKLYVNGTQVTSFITASYPAQNTNTNWNATDTASIGRIFANTYQFDGYMSEIYNIDGQALTPSSFGEYNSDNIWMPKSYSGTYGTNGFYLNFSDNSGATATTIGKDSSGNSNNWTPSGISVTAGTTNDSLTDTPTDYGTDTGAGGEVRGNYCVLNPLSTTAGTYSNGNLRYVGASAWRRSNATISVSTGKWYFETTIGNSPYTPRGSTTSYNAFGFGLSTVFNSTATTSTLTDAVILADNGYYKNFSGSFTDGGTAFSSGDTLAIAVDLNANTFTFYRNNTQITTGTIGCTAGTQLVPIIVSYDGSYGVMDANFGQRPFAYTAPSGFKALTTANITAPADASKWFYGGVPDLVWIKDRTSAYDHSLTDTVRGVGLNLISDTTGTDTSGPDISEMSKYGMSLIGPASSNRVNASGDNYVYWAWKAGGAAVTNNSGTISSQVSANPTSGFSVVTYTGNLSSAGTATVGHGLGVAPSMVITKARNTTSDFIVWHSSLASASYMLYLQSTSAAADSSTYGTLSAPTSTVFGTNYVTGRNVSGNSYVAYCWAAIPGFSAFGSYTGNGSTDGPFVFCGFRPRWLMIKRTDTTSDWWMYDTSRDTYNQTNALLYADLNSAENTGGTNHQDILSNGFKLRDAGTGDNVSGGTYIYAAFADVPFKYARAR